MVLPSPPSRNLCCGPKRTRTLTLLPRTPGAEFFWHFQHCFWFFYKYCTRV